MTLLKSNAETMRRVLFRRVDDPALQVPYYVLREEPERRWSPTPTTRDLAGALHAIALMRGCWIDVTPLAQGRKARNPRKAIQQALGRIVGQVADVSPELGLVLAGCEFKTEGNMVLARLRSLAGLQVIP